VGRSLDDYWSWFAEQLDYSGGRLEDESVQVQIVEDAGTGERPDLTQRSTSPMFSQRSSSSWSEASTGQRLPDLALFGGADRCGCA